MRTTRTRRMTSRSRRPRSARSRLDRSDERRKALVFAGEKFVVPGRDAPDQATHEIEVPPVVEVDDRRLDAQRNECRDQRDQQEAVGGTPEHEARPAPDRRRDEQVEYESTAPTVNVQHVDVAVLRL